MHQTRFMEKMVELRRLRRKILEVKAEISVSGMLVKYTHRAGESVLNKTSSHKSSYVTQLFKARNADITKKEKRYV